MKTGKRKRFAILLTMAMVVTTVEGVSKKDIIGRAATDYGISNPVVDDNGITSWDCIYFGNYWQNDTNGNGTADQKDDKEPIKWRVLSVDGDDAFLMADKILDAQPYDEDEKQDVTWENSTLRKWLNDDFYNMAFSEYEKRAINTVTVGNDNEYDTEDDVSLLSFNDVIKNIYGFTTPREDSATREDSTTREASVTSYAGERTSFEEYGVYAGSGPWWLRTISRVGDEAVYVKYIPASGRSSSASASYNIEGVRPVIHLDLASSYWKKAERTGSVGTDDGSIITMPNKQTAVVTMPEFDKSAIVHQGEDGAISWAIDAQGCLLLEGTGDYEGLGDSFVITGGEPAKYPKWLDYSSDIVAAKVNIQGITNCKYMFYGCSAIRAIDLKNFDTSKVTTMDCMFRNCSRLQLLDVSKFDTTCVKSMYGMFYGCEELQNINVSNFDTSNVIDMMGMFEQCCSVEELDLSNFDISKASLLGYMFSGCDRLSRLDISSFDFAKGGKQYGLKGLDDLECLTEIKTPLNISASQEDEDDEGNDLKLPVSNLNYTVWKDEDGKVYQNLPSETNKSITLKRKIKNSSVITPLEGKCGQLKWNVDDKGQLTISGKGNFSSISGYPAWHRARNYIKSCTVNVTGITDTSYMFADLPYLETITFETFDTSKVYKMSYMFYNDFSLTSLDVNNFDTSNVTDMSGLFCRCSNLEEIDLTQFRTEKVENFDDMFSGCHKLRELDLRNFEIADIESMGISNMFAGCFNLKELQFGDFKDKISYLQCVFECCHNLTNLDISGWNLENVPQHTRYNSETDSSEPEPWSSFLGGAVSLSQIKTPIHLKVEVALPEGNWTDESGKQYTNLPMNLSESILLKNTEKPPQETARPTPTQKPSPTVSPLPDHTPSPSAAPSGTEVKKAVLKSVKNKKGKKAVIRWKKVKGASGYQIAYAVNKKFKKKKTKNVTKTTVTLKKLKKKKTYYIKVRAYKKIKGEKVYGKWSNVKKVKIKK